MLRLSGIKKDYLTASETVHALKGVDLCFRESEFVSILGPSGCGKTTLLNIIGGLDHYTDGDLIINGRSTRSYRDRDWDVYRNHRVGFIFQSYNLIPHQTVLGNVELALTISGIGREERISRAKEALDKVGLKGQYYKRPNQLSGGQCQRVAIARALVNDPEILLADEPTGALDTVTSVQIMELIKEISGERLVIMVTHNPELAEKYSSRIIRLLDGEVTEDTNPMSPEEEEAERASAMKKADADVKTKKPKTEKAKMSFFTAFRLSARNLISKKGRTFMVGLAGSIGIIGIAMVLAFSAGIKGYVASMQDDMLSGNPIEIADTAYDMDALSGMMGKMNKGPITKLPDRVYINSLIEYLAQMHGDMQSIVVENEITPEYVEYVRNMPEEYYAAILYSYGIDMSSGLYTGFKETVDGEEKMLSISRLTSLYTSILQNTDFKEYASYVTALAPSMKQAPSNSDYIMSQYNLVSGSIADGKNEIMLVLDSDDELSDLLLARFGFYTQDEFIAIVDKAVAEENDEEISRNYRDSFAYDELVGKTMYWYPNDTVFELSKLPLPTGTVDMWKYNSDAAEFTDEGAVELTVVGILTPKDTVSYGCLTSGIYYTEELSRHILAENGHSQIIEYLLDEEKSAAMAQMYYYIAYNYTYNYDADGDGVAEELTANGTVGPSMSLLSSMMGGSGDGSKIDTEKLRETFIRNLGGNDVANEILIYPLSFNDKDLATEYLDLWNEEGDIEVNGETLSYEQRNDITYTDTLELVINMINTMIDVVSYALVAFTSISLVVSTVMIGIITYVSVVERIKEIGVIRSLGGRKRDVSHLFNAETFIIGLLAGLIGIAVTYLVSLAVNLLLAPVINYPSIAALPIWQAVLLVALSIGLTLISGLIPASSAAKKDPVVALRTE